MAAFVIQESVNDAVDKWLFVNTKETRLNF